MGIQHLDFQDKIHPSLHPILLFYKWAHANSIQIGWSTFSIDSVSVSTSSASVPCGCGRQRGSNLGLIITAWCAQCSVGHVECIKNFCLNKWSLLALWSSNYEDIINNIEPLPFEHSLYIKHTSVFTWIMWFHTHNSLIRVEILS